MAMIKQYYRRYLKDIPLSPPIFEFNLEELTRHLEFLEGDLEGKTFVAGTEKLTFADLQVFNELSSVYALKIDISKYKNILRWRENVLAQKEVKEVNDIFEEGLPEWQKMMGIDAS